ncbi:hypothetical protein NQ315_004031 [Exocentrus adspersus]|uniref:Ig-like domain-containing protein n=1 Tax=Exocentrus adspersus TaxID=1586481 RepID=A0AAV8W6M7_9CUCU|nr:hypothetical protein NQ315_004031 [Exocentrus adspersus]
MDKLASLIFICSFCCVSALINITELKGPDSIEYGSTEEIILDCNFEAEKERDLEVKWFYNGDTEVVYQWVPDSHKPGYAMGRLKGRIDLDYSATNDSNTRYRALKIFNVTTDLTGNYTCKVSSFDSEDSETKQLIIYTPARSGLDLVLLEEDQTVICTVYGVFPKPELKLYLTGENDTKLDVDEITVNNTQAYQEDPDNGSYNVTIVHYFPNLTSFSDNIDIVCELTIPGTDYFLSKSVTYHTESSAVIHSPGVIVSTIFATAFLLLCK